MSEQAEKLAVVRAACESCQRCALGATRTNLVLAQDRPMPV